MPKRPPLPPIPIPADRAAQPCPLCGRPLGSRHVDEHHLVPKSEGGKAKFAIHRVCHTKIHSLFTEAELARERSDWERLRASPDIQAFVRWVAPKPPEFLDRNRRAARKGPR